MHPRQKQSTHTPGHRGPATHLLYRQAFTRFVNWCDDHGQSALPATQKALNGYASHLIRAGTSPTTLHVVEAAVRVAHGEYGLQSPSITASAFAGARRDPRWHPVFRFHSTRVGLATPFPKGDRPTSSSKDARRTDGARDGRPGRGGPAGFRAYRPQD